MQRIITTALFSGVLIAVAPAVVLGDAIPKKGATSYVTHFVFHPLSSIDVPGVGELVRMGVERGRKTRPALKIGICGEHGGDAASIHFFHQAGLNYVSASPYRVPAARLAAAQAALSVKVGD